MIKSITMKNCATYNNLGITINNCTQVNFIYGANGSGKSTIGNYLSSLDDSTYYDCGVEFDGDIKSDLLIYNRKFRETHLGKSELPGVFTLGSSTKEDIENVNRLKIAREDKKSELTRTRATLETKKAELDNKREKFKEAIWKLIYKKYQTEFYDAFKLLHNSKEKYYEYVIDRFRLGARNIHNINELRVRAKSLFSGELINCNLLPLISAEVIENIASIESNSIWSKVIVGNDDVPIAKLIKILDNADWVSKGRNYIVEDTCPFCQQRTISVELRQQIEEFFGGEYTKDTNDINKLSNGYKNSTDSLLNNLNSVIVDMSVIAVSGMDIDRYKKLLEIISAKINNNISRIDSKVLEPSRKVVLESIASEIDTVLLMISESNKRLAEHNKIVADIKNEKKKLIDELWEFFIEEQRTVISTYWNERNNLARAIEGITKKCGELNKCILDLDKEIVEAEKNITSVQPAIDEINRSLAAYGFSGFRIVPSSEQKNFYQIQREDGSLVSATLSEGEETFITFLYFMQMSKGANNVAKISSKKIMIIDDPICSLDSNVLFIVSVILKDLISKIQKNESDVEQLFILTHNIYFHRETSYHNGRPEERNRVHFWILRKENNVTNLNFYGKTNPINSSYELLWRELREDTATSIITVQNVMRRILENYFALLGNKRDDTLIKSFLSIEEQWICESLLTWINDGSHTISDDLFVDGYSDIIQKYKEVFHQIFIKMGHEAHYNMMMQIEAKGK